MKNGDKIKFFDGKRWETVVFVQEDQGCPIIKKSDGQHQRVLPYRVKIFEPITEGEVLANAKKNIGQLYDLVHNAVKNIFVGVIPVEIKEEKYLSIFNGQITVDPVEVEVETIARFKEYPGWAVSVWREYPGTRLDPPDFVDTFIGNARTTVEAAKLVIATLAKILADGFWQMKDDEEYAKMMDAAEKEAERQGNLS